MNRNRSLASALNIDIDQSTTSTNGPSPHITATNLPYSAETLDMYIQLSSSSTLSTLQSYESTLHSLAISSTQRSVRFQPAKAPLRAFAHSLAADWGFATESFDPEPHRHVFVLKPTTWTPPIFGFGNGSSMGIGGMSVGDCVKFRERERMKEREAQRAAVAEAKALREANAGSKASGADGWAQVASRKKNGSDTVIAPPAMKTGGFASVSGSFYAALAGESAERSGNSGRLVLRSGVGASKNLRNKVEVADSWEEEVEKEEEDEKKEIEQEQSAAPGSADGKDQGPPVPQGPHDDGDTIDKSEKLGVESVVENS
ncbi:FKBP12-associated protein [Paecilomyces lecythidis]|uniref:FKBP12-associated protein n=1 Tax=Paecilomyces lecythidis TaxID=3004212 RepID=A0ABR3X6H7_9EURO